MFVIANLGYCETRYGRENETVNEKEFWWYSLCIMTIWYGSSVLKFFVQHLMLVKDRKNSFLQRKNIRRRFFVSDNWVAIGYTLKMLTQIILPCLLLDNSLDHSIMQKLAATNVIIACFDTMLAVARFPGIGVYVFMLQRVFRSIIRFFATYFCHFLGYAFAFHIIMPKQGAFLTIGDSIIKVRIKSKQ